VNIEVTDNDELAIASDQTLKNRGEFFEEFVRGCSGARSVYG
jgi:hypothetical protein